ncbi:MAG: hypothetical protein K2W94_05530 [Alphaproteobacteria bacterium]|nr:hypothetical protein [Alphaproteobacteria bacterium]
MKKLSNQILLGGAIFIAFIAFCNFSTFASEPEGLEKPEEPPVVTLAKYIPQIKTLASEKQAILQDELASLPVGSTKTFTSCKAILDKELVQAKYLLQFADNAEKYLNLYKTLNDTMISGDDLSQCKQLALAAERDPDQPSVSAKRRLDVQPDQPLAAIVMAFSEEVAAQLRFDVFGEFEYARPLIVATLARVFPGEDLDSLAAETNAWIKTLYGYDLNDANAREAGAIKELERLASDPSGALSTPTKHWERERDLGVLEIEIVEDSEKLWDDVWEIFKGKKFS